jgi:tRNA threonylcarbamoyladenosine biosynthesis protein TsaB
VPTATALLRLAPRLLALGAAVVAADTLPVYVRDKVARTTDEREAERLAALGQA